MQQPFRYASLFTGIGGLDLGLDRAGMTPVAQVEQDPFRRSVLSRHWPEVPRHDDVRTAPVWWRRAERPPVRLVAGGFPCQPVSHAGLNLGDGDPRWGWPWYRGFIDAILQAQPGDPLWVLIENVRGLVSTHRDLFGRVLGDLAERGFDAEWSLVSACSVGAPHMRRRLFVVAHTAGVGRGGRSLAEAWEQAGRPEPEGGRESGRVAGGPDAERWGPEPSVGRVAYGVPDRMERISALGDAVVPRVAEMVGRRILRAEQIMAGG
jgi:DNA (cytosine-5)-methyltransferase 1